MCQIPSPLNGLLKHCAPYIRLDASVQDTEPSLALRAGGRGGGGLISVWYRAMVVTPSPVFHAE